MKETFKAGASIEAAYPFVREMKDLPPIEGELRRELCWRPGTRYSDEDGWPEAEAMGTLILDIISIHKSGHWPTRIFFTRRWRDPEGREFGKDTLRIRSVGQFRQLAGGYRHRFRLLSDPQITGAAA